MGVNIKLMAHNPEISWDVYTSEQAQILGIELPKQPWWDRLCDRVRVTMKYTAIGIVGGGITSFAGMVLIGDGVIRVASLFTGTDTETESTYFRTIAPYAGIFGAIGTGLILGEIAAFSGEEILNPQLSVRSS